MKSKWHIVTVLTVLKYLFALIVTVLAFLNTDNVYYLVVDVLELLTIFVLSNFLMRKKLVGQIVNDILILLYNVQMIVMMFGSSYITMVMLTNIASIEDLAGRAGLYITGALLALIFSFIPIQRYDLKKKIEYIALPCALGLEIIVLTVAGITYSPLYSYLDLAIQQYRINESNQMIASAVSGLTAGDGELTVDYYQVEVKDYIKKEDDLTEQPNVILVFTEGLSQNIISDERNIMPNVAAYQDKSLSFTNYYNHTFATYRGLIGQLYSGYQLSDFDTNSLISIQSILADQGYNTFYINTEPHNQEFTQYLESFGFDEMIGDASYECNGMVDTISDKDAYEILYDSALEQAESGEPFFMAMYTFGTHVSLDSTDEKWGQGKDAVLNRFYNLDYQFGEFMEKFTGNPVFDNTIFVFTADHAAYRDDSFNTAFPDYVREFAGLDEIPFFIYYNGIDAESIDAGGRNSLGLAPTILDYLDISAPNYFIGSSLFSGEAGNVCETSYSDSYVIYSSKDGRIRMLEGEEFEEVDTMMKRYYITKEVVAKQ